MEGDKIVVMRSAHCGHKDSYILF